MPCWRAGSRHLAERVPRVQCNRHEPFERVVHCLVKELGHPVIVRPVYSVLRMASPCHSAHLTPRHAAQFAYVKEAFMPALEEEVGMLLEVRRGQRLGTGDVLRRCPRAATRPATAASVRPPQFSNP